MTQVELNMCKIDDKQAYQGTMTKSSPIVEVFSAMANEGSVEGLVGKYGKANVNATVAHIKGLGERIGAGDASAMVELNTVRRFVLEAPVMEELKALSVFGSYENVAYGESVEREVYNRGGEFSREQAAGGDVVFPVTSTNTYPVPFFTVSGGFATDYRKLQSGDMTAENEGLQAVRTDILNNAQKRILKTIIAAIKAGDIKHVYEHAGLTKTGVDKVIRDIRRYAGKATVLGDISLTSQFNDFAGYQATINSKDILGISQKILDEIAANGALSNYNGTIINTLDNTYDFYRFVGTGDNKNYATVYPEGIGLVLPVGKKSPVATFSRGGLTSFSGNDVATGKVLTRFDVEVAGDVAQGREGEVGLIIDSNLAGL